jgi:hypothetical protein
MTRDLHPKTPDGPRRVLALSGGGVRGIVEVAFLEAVEAAYRRRFGPDVRICDLFDLVGGTSTGALIATAVSLGHPMSRIRDFYLTRAHRFFGRKKWWKFGHAPVLDCAALETEFRKDVGRIALGDPEIKTLLAIVIKRLDTGSSWIVNNIPTAPFFDDPPDGHFRGNRHFELAQLLRATTAAPLYFSQEVIELEKDGFKGVFVDGGLTPYNDPSLALLQLVRLRAFGLQWPLSVDGLFFLSLGTGRYRLTRDPAEAAGLWPYEVLTRALSGMIGATEQHSLTMMEWLGTSPAPTMVNSEIGTLENDTLARDPLFTYLRLDIPLDPGPVSGLSPADAKRFQSFDNPAVIHPLYAYAQDHIARTWDLDTLLL